MSTELILEYLPFILPLILVQYALAIFALVHVVKHPNYRFGNRAIWILIVLFLQIIGPVIYFTIGRGDE